MIGEELAIILIMNALIMLGVAWLVFRSAYRTGRYEGSHDLLERFRPEPVFRRFKDGRPVERATSSRVAITKTLIENEEAESQRLRVIS